MCNNENVYLGQLQYILDRGIQKKDRTGTGTLSVFGTQMRFDLTEGFPLFTTKKLHIKSIVHELLWFLNGDTNVSYLNDNGVKIWNDWANSDGDLGPVYGKQWRKWVDYKVVEDHDLDRASVLRERGYKIAGYENVIYANPEIWKRETDQISTVVDQLRTDPDSRRIIVSAWNVGDLEDMALQPCHSFFQFYTRELTIEERLYWIEKNHPEQFSLTRFTTEEVMDDDKLAAKLDTYGVPRRTLSCHLTMRSMDFFLGTPFNVASYALLTHMLAQQVDMAVGELIISGGDSHIYLNHLEQVKLQLSRKPCPAPTLVIKRKPESIFDYKFEDFEFEGYVPHDAIKAPVSI